MPWYAMGIAFLCRETDMNIGYNSNELLDKPRIIIIELNNN